MAPELRYLVFTPFIIATLINSAETCAQNGEHVLWYDEPASEWVEALPVGNPAAARHLVAMYYQTR